MIANTRLTIRLVVGVVVLLAYLYYNRNYSRPSSSSSSISISQQSSLQQQQQSEASYITAIEDMNTRPRLRRYLRRHLQEYIWNGTYIVGINSTTTNNANSTVSDQIVNIITGRSSSGGSSSTTSSSTSSTTSDSVTSALTPANTGAGGSSFLDEASIPLVNFTVRFSVTSGSGTTAAASRSSTAVSTEAVNSTLAQYVFEHYLLKEMNILQDKLQSVQLVVYSTHTSATATVNSSTTSIDYSSYLPIYITTMKFGGIAVIIDSDNDNNNATINSESTMTVISEIRSDQVYTLYNNDRLQQYVSYYFDPNVTVSRIMLDKKESNDVVIRKWNDDNILNPDTDNNNNRPSSSTTGTTNQSNSMDPNTIVVIIAGVVGGLLVLTSLGVWAFYCYIDHDIERITKKKNKNKKSTTKTKDKKQRRKKRRNETRTYSNDPTGELIGTKYNTNINEDNYYNDTKVENYDNVNRQDESNLIGDTSNHHSITQSTTPGGTASMTTAPTFGSSTPTCYYSGLDSEETTSTEEDNDGKAGTETIRAKLKNTMIIPMNNGNISQFDPIDPPAKGMMTTTSTAALSVPSFFHTFHPPHPHNRVLSISDVSHDESKHNDDSDESTAEYLTMKPSTFASNENNTVDVDQPQLLHSTENHVMMQL